MVIEYIGGYVHVFASDKKWLANCNANCFFVKLEGEICTYLHETCVSAMLIQANKNGLVTH